MSLYYEKGILTLGDRDPCAILPLAKKTPFYLYHLGEMLARVEALQKAKLSIHYAMKANSNAKILKAFATAGVGADVVSLGEIRLAQAAGISDIIFSGVAKTHEEIEFALKAQIKQINVESLAELVRIAEIAKKLGKKAPIAFRFNPDVDAQTHPYIATGLHKNKFGMDKNAVPELIALVRKYSDSLLLQGVSIHIGSQITDLAPIADAIQKTLLLFGNLRREGFPLKTFDVGGGLGIDYKADLKRGSQDFTRLHEYVTLIEKLLGGLDAEILCEPGRILVGASGVLVGKVEYTKHSPQKNFLIGNTGVHHLIRPALYKAFHRILPLQEHSGRPKLLYDVVGPLCESSDVLGEDRELPELNAGEFFAVADAGAYGFVMANRYNHHEFPEEVVWYQGRVI